MGMFETTGTASATEKRKGGTLQELERMKKTFRHEEADRVPISDFFGGGYNRLSDTATACQPFVAHRWPKPPPSSWGGRRHVAL